jgi:hypothetical protein
MPYHVEFAPPEAAIYEGPGRNNFETTHETFAEAKAEALVILEDHLAAVQEWLQYIRDAQSMEDLPRYKSD